MPDVSVASQFFEQGAASAGRHEWGLAAREFGEAQRAEPLRPEILYNLGVASERAGSPVLASLWFRAFLEAADPSSRRDDVSAELDALQIRIEKKTAELIRLAQKTAESIPEEMGEIKEESWQALDLLLAVTGEKKERSESLRMYGEYLAAARDYEGAEAVLNELTEPYERNRLLNSLGSYQLERDERDLALQTIRKMNESAEKVTLLQGLLALYTRELDIRKALPLVDEVKDPGNRFKLQDILLLGYLKADRMEEAKRLASENKTSKIARVILGNGEAVVGEMHRSKTDPKEPWRKEFEAYQTATALAWSGDFELAQRAAETAGKGDYGKLARAFVAVEKGQWDETSSLMREMSLPLESEFALSLFFRLIQKGEWGEAEKFSGMVRSNAARANLFELLSRKYREKGEQEKASEFAIRSFDLAVEANSSIALRNLARDAAESGNPGLVEGAYRIERVIHWVTLARALERKGSIQDLTGYLEIHRNGDFLSMGRALIQAATDWASALVFIRGTEKWHNRK